MRKSVSRITRQARSSSTTRTVEPRRSSGVGAIGFGGVNGTRSWRSISVEMAGPVRRGIPRRARSAPARAPRTSAMPVRPAAPKRLKDAVPTPTPAALIHELSSCVTEADIVQVLYRGLHPLFDYGVVLLQVLER